MSKSEKYDKKLVDFYCNVFDMDKSWRKVILFPIAVGAVIIDFALFGWIPFQEEGRLVE